MFENKQSAQTQKVRDKSTKTYLTDARNYAVVAGVTMLPAVAFADEGGGFALDTSSILTAVGVVLAAVTAVALAAVAIPLTIKGVKYLKAAF